MACVYIFFGDVVSLSTYPYLFISEKVMHLFLQTIIMDNLKPYTTYLVSLQVFNPAGNGPKSTIQVKTEEGSK